MSNISCGVTGFVISRLVSRVLRVVCYELPNPRINHFPVLAAAEDAVVPHGLRLEMLLVLRGDALREPLGRLGLAVAGDVVQLALDREERRSPDRLGTHAFARDRELALGKEVL